MERTIGIGLLGAGTVGGTLVRRLVGESEEIAAKTGLRFDVRRIGVRDLERARDFPVTPGMLTTDPFEVVNDDTVDLLVEVMGGREPAGDLILAAIANGKPVVTANKELIAARGHRRLSRLDLPAGISMPYSRSRPRVWLICAVRRSTARLRIRWMA